MARTSMAKGLRRRRSKSRRSKNRQSKNRRVSARSCYRASSGKRKASDSMIPTESNETRHIIIVFPWKHAKIFHIRYDGNFRKAAGVTRDKSNSRESGEKTQKILQRFEEHWCDSISTTTPRSSKSLRTWVCARGGGCRTRVI